jgi:hypothetical protein
MPVKTRTDSSHVCTSDTQADYVRSVALTAVNMKLTLLAHEAL